MKNILFLILILISTVSFSQNPGKKEILLDENLNLIGLAEFKEKKKDRNYISKFIENDTAFIGKISFREAVGKITPDLRLSVINYLRKVTGLKIDSTKNIVINFF
ncbi:hypothetical protein [Christiangramia sabulilitoris]|uniref:Uncharacterized protein n=1 Tax=Christiangramia sabulilitoris TaxID=2583991 RepID=A0A550I779_9FLAO|nr:hypothetical protein [Christiangramia sabulilitoris]TRO66835.1 hypothetical protein FGM01_02780 [Christiangramia sabulilitoris]